MEQNNKIRRLSAKYWMWKQVGTRLWMIGYWDKACVIASTEKLWSYYFGLVLKKETCRNIKILSKYLTFWTSNFIDLINHVCYNYTSKLWNHIAMDLKIIILLNNILLQMNFVFITMVILLNQSNCLGCFKQDMSHCLVKIVWNDKPEHILNQVDKFDF